MPARKQLGLEFNDKAEFSVFTLAKENYYLWPNTSFTFVKRICTRHCQRNRAQNDINTTTTSKRQFVFFLLVSGAGPPKIAQNVRTCEHWGSKSHIFCGRSHIFCWGCANGGGDGCLRSYNLVQSRIYTSKKYTPSIIQSSAKLTKVFVPARKIVETSSSRGQEQLNSTEGMEKLDSGCNIECTCCNYLHIFFLLKI